MKRKSWYAWMAVRPNSGEPWSEPWVYIRKTKPKEIRLSGYKAIRVKITVEPSIGRSEMSAQDACYCGELLPGKTCLVCRLKEAESKLAAAEARLAESASVLRDFLRLVDEKEWAGCDPSIYQRAARLAEIGKERSGQ